MFAEVNGVKLHYESVGEGRPLILLHGNSGDMGDFDVAVEELKDWYNVITVDTRGHGLSSPVDVYHYDDMAEDVFQLIQYLGLEKPILYGYSDGGITGLILAYKHPDTLLRLAVSGPNSNPSTVNFDGFGFDFDDPRVKMMLVEPHLSKYDLAEITVPTLVLAGENDCVDLDDIRSIADSIPYSHMMVMPGETHGSYVEHSEKIAWILKDWLP